MSDLTKFLEALTCEIYALPSDTVITPRRLIDLIWAARVVSGA